MMTPEWPDWGGDPDRYFPWHTYRGALGDLHAGHLLATVVAPDVTTGKDRPYEIVRCASCISIHTWPLPRTEDLAHYYAAHFYEHDKPDYIARYERDRTWWETCVHSPLLQQALMLIPYRESMQWPRMMEIGAGPGIALDVALEWDWMTYALEPNPRCAQRLKQRGHQVLQLTLEQLPQHQGQWAEGMDVLYLYEVLEHLPCPEDFLDRCYQILKPGGVLVICVPNDCSPIQYDVCEYLKREPYWYAPPQHLHYFSPKMLQLLVRRCGFTIRDIRGSAALELAIFDGYDYIGDDRVGRAVHTERMGKELVAVEEGRWEGVEAQYRVNMAEARLGREIVCLAQKPY